MTTPTPLIVGLLALNAALLAVVVELLTRLQKTRANLARHHRAIEQLLRWADEGGVSLEPDFEFPTFTIVLPDGRHSHGGAFTKGLDPTPAGIALARESLLNFCLFEGNSLSFAHSHKPQPPEDRP